MWAEMGEGLAHHQHQQANVWADMGERFAHHQHQLAPLWVEPPRAHACQHQLAHAWAKAAKGMHIISNSWLVCGLGETAECARVISICWLWRGLTRPRACASSASAGSWWAEVGEGFAHHQHQLARVWAEMSESFAHHQHQLAPAGLKWARVSHIISISWLLVG